MENKGPDNTLYMPTMIRFVSFCACTKALFRLKRPGHAGEGFRHLEILWTRAALLIFISARIKCVQRATVKTFLVEEVNYRCLTILQVRPMVRWDEEWITPITRVIRHNALFYLKCIAFILERLIQFPTASFVILFQNVTLFPKFVKLYGILAPRNNIMYLFSYI